jgi:lipopolysaccharide transport system ATP-binding protein
MGSESRRQGRKEGKSEAVVASPPPRLYEWVVTRSVDSLIDFLQAEQARGRSHVFLDDSAREGLRELYIRMRKPVAVPAAEAPAAAPLVKQDAVVSGSGKSTLLQLLCGTLDPTDGCVISRGKIAALLELGSGFNPDFTGKENIYINASILGLSTDEINLRYKDIVAFADIGDFIDQPVRTYSSGMVIRVAFAVMAHVDADILVIDEALAVGDAIFMQKCMRFIRNFQKTKTLILVSHDIASVQNLCTETVWLKDGEIELIGETKFVTEAYQDFVFKELYGNKKNDLNSLQKKPVDASRELAPTLSNSAAGWKTGICEIISSSLVSLETNIKEYYEGDDLVKLSITVLAFEDLANCIIGFVIKDRLGQILAGENADSSKIRQDICLLKNDSATIVFEFKMPLFASGEYAISIAIATGNLKNLVQQHWVHDAHIFIVNSPIERYGIVGLDVKAISIAP